MSTPTTSPREISAFEQRVGHPPGLFMLFFAEMWERFSFYGMKALLVFYMTKGFLGFGDKESYAVYGAYTSLVYMTPFLGGMIADKLLGARRTVVLGGILMAAGHLLMTIEQSMAFFVALSLLIVGNGFFKPNISTIVGGLYGEHNKDKRDGGFTIFYMGINLGAAMAPLLCAYIGEKYGWHYGFGLATIGMLIGLAIFIAPSLLTQVLIGLGALASTVGMIASVYGDNLMLAVNIPIALALLVAAYYALSALQSGSLPKEAGAPPSPETFAKSQTYVLLGTLVAIPVFAFLVKYSDIAGIVLSVFGGLAFLWVLQSAIKSEKVERERLFVVLIMCFFSMLFWSFFEQAGSSVNNFTDRNVDRVREERIITQADIGKSVSFEINQEQLGFETPVMKHTIKAPFAGMIVESSLTPESVVKPEQELASFEIVKEDKKETKKLSLKEINPTLREGKFTWIATPGKAFKENDPLFAIESRRMVTLDYVDTIKTEEQERLKDKARASEPKKTLQTWTIEASHVGMGINGAEIPASVFQAANPAFILFFGLVFTALWAFLAKRNMDPSTPMKFVLGLLQLGLGFAAFWWGAQQGDTRGMSTMTWLLVGYLLQTTGELCLSPVGLSMVTQLAPQRMVSAVMGAWFLATAFSQYLAAIIAQFTGVSESEDGAKVIPPPSETLHVYGEVFYKIAIASAVSAVLLMVLTPLIKKWMHEDKPMSGEASRSGH